MTSKQFVSNLAQQLHAQGQTMMAYDLANQLNANGIKTTYGSTYAGARGTYTLIEATYHWLDNQGLSNDAHLVAVAFTKPDGTYAYN